MTELSQFKGAGTALVTPFTSTGRIDETALRQLVDFQIDNGIDFLVPCGTTGESATMTLDEHLFTVDTVVKQAAGRVPVLAGAGGNCTHKVIDMAKAVAETGVDALLSVTPYYNKPSQEGLVAHFTAIANAVNLPIVLYNVPSRTQCNMLPDTVLRLSEIDNVVALKAASGDISQIGEMAVKKPENFLILSGDDPNTLPIIALGGSGVISVVSNQAPAEIVQLTHLCLEGKFAEAMTLQKRLFQLMRLNFIEVNPVPVKAGLAMMGMMEEYYRLPMVPMSDEKKTMLRAEMERLGLIS